LKAESRRLPADYRYTRRERSLRDGIELPEHYQAQFQDFLLA
jgi:hypothetical protein